MGQLEDLGALRPELAELADRLTCFGDELLYVLHNQKSLAPFLRRVWRQVLQHKAGPPDVKASDTDLL